MPVRELIEEEIQNIVCQECNGPDDEDEMLLCDECDRGWHIFCLDPPLPSVPKGNWTRADCRQKAKQCEMVTGLRHTDLMQQGYGRLEAPVAIDAQRFDPVEQASEMYEHLKEHGFVVVKEVADDKEILKAKKLLWDYLEDWGEGHIDRADPDTWWCDPAWAPNAKDGIIYGRGIGQSEFMWHLRLLPRVRKAFAGLWSHILDQKSSASEAGHCYSHVNCLERSSRYALRSSDAGADEKAEAPQVGLKSSAKYHLRSVEGGGKRRRIKKDAIQGLVTILEREQPATQGIEEDLLVSFDGAGVYRPWRRRRCEPTKGGWYHVDQNFWNVGRQGLACVQGLVSLTDVHEGTGGLVLFPGSHHLFSKLSKMKRVKEEYQDRSEDYVRFHDKDLYRMLVKNKQRRMMPSLVRARAGDMILWDSRVVHAGTPGWIPENLGRGAHADKTGNIGGRTFPELASKWVEPEGELLRVAAYICMMPARCIPRRYTPQYHKGIPQRPPPLGSDPKTASPAPEPGLRPPALHTRN